MVHSGIKRSGLDVQSPGILRLAKPGSNSIMRRLSRGKNQTLQDTMEMIKERKIRQKKEEMEKKKKQVEQSPRALKRRTDPDTKIMCLGSMKRSNNENKKDIGHSQNTFGE